MAVPRTLVSAVGTLILAGSVLLTLLWLFQRRLIYIPLVRHVPPAAEILPGSVEITFPTEDGLDLHGWYLPAAGNSGAAVLVCNGNAGNRSLRAPLARALATGGLSVLLFDYRGYAENPGHPSETGLMADARAARRYLAGRDQVRRDRIVLFGESLGAAIAVGLAVEEAPAAVILRSPFTSLVDTARIHYPFLPVGTLLRDRYPSLDRIDRIEAPLLVVAGEHDSIIPAAQSRALFDAAVEPKRFLLVPGVDHNDFELLAGDRMVAAIFDFLARGAGMGRS